MKLYVIASVAARAQRRYREMQERGIATTLAAIEDDLIARDMRDSTRAEAPLKPADDAVLLDTSALDRDAAVAAAIAIVDRRRKSIRQPRNFVSWQRQKSTHHWRIIS